MPDANMKHLRTFLIQVEERNTQKTAHSLGVTKTTILAHRSRQRKSLSENVCLKGAASTSTGKSGGRS